MSIPILGSFQLPATIFKPDDDEFSAQYEEAGRAAVENYSLYYEVCAALQPRSIFEIGVRAGYSAYAMLSGCPTGTSFRGLDLNEGTYGGQIGYTEYAKQMLPQWFPESNIKIMYGDSQHYGGLDMEFDLCHVDGDHSFAGALHDMELCAHHADYVLVDDVNYVKGVTDAVREFLYRHQIAFKLDVSFFDSWRGHVLIRTANMRKVP